MLNNVETSDGKVSTSHNTTSTATITSHITSCVLIVSPIGLPFELSVKLHDLRKFGWGEVDISLNGETVWPTSVFKLRETEVAKLLFKPNHPAEKQVFTIELESIKRPITIWGEEFTNDERVFLMFL